MHYRSNDLSEQFLPSRKDSITSHVPSKSTHSVKIGKNLFQPDSGIKIQEAFKNLLNSAFPSILALFFVLVNDTVNLIFAGQNFSSPEISAIGLGSFYVNSVGFILGIGILGGVDTICSLAWGAKQYYVLGLYVNIARVSLFYLSILIIIPLILISGTILTRLNLEYDVIELTITYTKTLIPYVIFSLQHNANVRYLQSMNIFYPGMIVAMFTAILHPIFCLIVINYTSLGIKGIGYLMGLNSLLNFSLLLGYITYINPHPETNVKFLVSNSFEFRRIYDFLKLAIPSGIMFSADWIGFNLIILLSSYMNNDCLAANVILCTFTNLIEAIPVGFSFAVTFYIGNCMGSSKSFSAKVYFYSSAICGGFIILIISGLLYMLKDIISSIYCNEIAVVELFSQVYQTFIIFNMVDIMHIILNGIVKGIGKQKPASIFVIFVLYPINIPVGITLAFLMNYGFTGLWIAQLTSALLLTLSYLILLMLVDWENISTRAILKIKFLNEMIKKNGELLKMDKIN